MVYKISLGIEDVNDILHAWMHTIVTVWEINILGVQNQIFIVKQRV